MEQVLGFVQYYMLPFLVMLTVLVFVHEMGHYLVARWNGVKVETFSIGFGPEIFGRTDKKGTRWSFSLIPLGGYVKFLGDMDPTSAPDNEGLKELTDEQSDQAFHKKRVGQRAAIVVAGPMANFIYTIVVMAGLFIFVGQRVIPPVIGSLEPGGVAVEAGFLRGDRIVEINDRSVVTFQEAMQEILMSPEQPLNFVLTRDGQEVEIVATPKAFDFVDDTGSTSKVGTMGFRAFIPAIVGGIMPGMPAEAAGLMAGDHIVAIDNKSIEGFDRLQAVVFASEGRPLTVEYMRNGERLQTVMTAKKDKRQLANGKMQERWLLGVRIAQPPLVKLGPIDAVLSAGRESVLMLDRTFEYLGQMIGGQRGTEELGGPIRIAQYSGQAAKSGLETLIYMSALLSLNLGFINLLPIPVLDGGHLLFYFFEAIRGRPLTERMQEYALRFGFFMVISLMVFVTWNDLVNLRVVDMIAGLFS
jgi:regulator of sigma E protease